MIQAEATRSKRPRDPRLDVFRGVGMLIILVAHVPDDHWALWIPARFGFSDATEMFVFLSGMASAIAFGGVFDRGGGRMLLARVMHRIWQIYWVHIGLFLAVASLLVAAGDRPDGASYVQSLNLVPFFNDPATMLIGLVTLTYVPNYFDILPMYLVTLAMLPAMLFAERAHRFMPLALMAALWLSAQIPLVHFPAEPWSERRWFFDPLGWQLIFFVGFFLMRGTLPVPGFRWSLVAVATLVVAIAVPFSWHVVLAGSPFFREAARALMPLTDKTAFGLLRLVHFLALAYLAVQAVGTRGGRLNHPVVRPFTAVLMKVGQQSLAVFAAGMVMAQIVGFLLDHIGRGTLAVSMANLAGFAVLVATAYVVGWFKTAPWNAKERPHDR